MESIPFSLDQILENLAGILGLKSEEAGVELMFQVDPTIPDHLVGDPLRLNQVLTNLSNNAIKFTDEEGTVVISATLSERLDNELLLHFSVSDSGIGIAEEKLVDLFQSFTQADPSTTRKHGGTGLGLAISKKLVDLMGGEIAVTSVLGEGSTFSFTARFSECTVDCIDKKKLAKKEIGSLRILVVDDNKTSREVLTEMLFSFGFDCEEASSCKKAIAKLEEADTDKPFDLVLMDWHMPEMDGIEGTQAIQTDPRLSHVPLVVMVTAFGESELRRAASKITLADVLTKPVTPIALLKSIARVTGHEASAQKLETTQKKSKQKSAGGLQDLKVLLVEDNEINLELANELLTGEGMVVTTAENGLEALVCLEKDVFDLVLMDCQMPEMDGYEATRKIRQQENFKDLPILAMTANAMAGDKEKVLAVGMNDHIAKPIDPGLMFETIEKWTKTDEASY